MLQRLWTSPTTEPAPNLAVERELGLRPYFLEIDAANILGWRKAGDSPIAPIGQVRINEYVTEEDLERAWR